MHVFQMFQTSGLPCLSNNIFKPFRSCVLSCFKPIFLLPVKHLFVHIFLTCPFRLHVASNICMLRCSLYVCPGCHMVETSGFHIFQTIVSYSLRVGFRCFFKHILLMPFNHCFCMFYTRFPLICFGGVVLFACISNVFQTVCVTSFQTCFLLVFPLISNVMACLWSFVFACFSDVSNVRAPYLANNIFKTFCNLRSQLLQAYFRDACQALFLHVFHTFCFEEVSTCWLC